MTPPISRRTARAGPSRCPRLVEPRAPRHRREMGGVIHGDEPRGLGDRQRAVVYAEPPERVERDAQQMAEVDADHAAVRDDQHVVAVPMVFGSTRWRAAP